MQLQRKNFLVTSKQSISTQSDLERKPLRLEIFKSVSKMFFSKLIQISFQIIKALVIPKLVTPAAYGLWRSLTLVNQFSPYAQLGTYQTMTKEMPYLEGRGEWDKRVIIRNNTFYYNLSVSAFLGLGLLLCSIFTYGKYAEFYAHGLKLFALLVLLISLNQFYNEYLRIEKNFTLLGIVSALQPAINVILSIGLIIYTENVLSLAYAMIISNGLIFVIVLSKCGWPQYEGVRWAEIIRQIKVGFPLMLIPVMFVLVKGVDQVMILIFLNPEDLGYYSLALSIQGFIYMIPAVLGSVLVPYLFEHIGRTGSPQKSSHIFTVPTKIIAFVSAFSVILTNIVIHIPIRYYLPKYIPGLHPLYTLLLGTYGLALIVVAGNFLVINGKQAIILKLLAFAFFFSVMSNYAAIKGGYGISGVAWATFLTYFFYSCALLYAAYSLFMEGVWTILKEIGGLYSPFLYLGFVLLGINTFFPNNAYSFLSDVKNTSLQGGILLLFSLPLIWRLDKEIGIWNMVRNIVVR